MEATNEELARRFESLSTALIADASFRVGRHCAFVHGVQALESGASVAGRALPVRHFGSVDVFLEAFGGATRGDVVVIDNDGRSDEACIGDLTVLDAQLAGVAGFVVWGAVRDVSELLEIGLPVFCTGRCPVGPAGLRRAPAADHGTASVGSALVTRGQVVFADDDGVILVEADGIEQVLDTADEIGRREANQAEQARNGKSIRAQLQFSEYLERRRQDPTFTLRQHLEAIGGAIEV